MSESNTTLAVQSAPRASDQLASFLGIEKGMMLDTLKAQCFKGKRPDEVSDAQLAAFVSTANALQVNPLLPGFLYAYPERNGGITPILGPDGVMKKLDEMIVSGKLKGYECDVKMGADGKPESATAIIHRGNDATPAKYTAWFSEWCVTSNPNWQARPRHMIWVRAIKQAARQVIHGLPMDADEYEISQMQNVTPTEAAPDRPAPKPRSAKGAAAVKENAKVVEAEVVDVKAETAPEPAAKPAKVESFADAAAATEAAPAKAPEPAPAPKPVTPSAAPEPVAQKAMLADGEAMEITASVESFKTEIAKRNGADWPYVKARVTSPQFAGDVSMTDNALVDGKPIAAWQLDRPVVLKLRGKRYKSGALITLVESITEAKPVTVSEPDEF